MWALAQKRVGFNKTQALWRRRLWKETSSYGTKINIGALVGNTKEQKAHWEESDRYRVNGLYCFE